MSVTSLVVRHPQLNQLPPPAIQVEKLLRGIKKLSAEIIWPSETIELYTCEIIVDGFSNIWNHVLR
jgi:hypothetical protein